MKPATTLLVVCLLLSGCGANAPADAEAVDERADAPSATEGDPPSAGATPAPVVLDALDRIGDAVVGEAFDERDWLQAWTDEGTHPEVDCRHVGGGVLPAGMSMMVMEGKIARFELPHRAAPNRPRVQAPFGLVTGMSQRDVLARLPDGVQTGPHEYGDPGDVYLDWHEPGTHLGLRVEVVGDAAQAIFWGDAAATTLIEGCS